MYPAIQGEGLTLSQDLETGCPRLVVFYISVYTNFLCREIAKISECEHSTWIYFLKGGTVSL